MKTLSLLLLMAQTWTLLNHRPEAQHPQSPDIHRLAGRLPYLKGNGDVYQKLQRRPAGSELFASELAESFCNGPRSYPASRRLFGGKPVACTSAERGVDVASPIELL